MFTQDQIKAAHAKVKSGADFPAYIVALRRLGIVAYDTYVADGHGQYFGPDNYNIVTDLKYPQIGIASANSKEHFQHRLRMHQQGQTDYPTFCKDAADSGVEKWTVRIDDMTCTYYDRNGTALLVENIPAS